MNKVLFFLIATVHIALGMDYGRRFPSFGGYDDPYGFSGLKGFLKKQNEKQREEEEEELTGTTEISSELKAEESKDGSVTHDENEKGDVQNTDEAFETEQASPKDWGWSMDDVLYDYCL